MRPAARTRQRSPGRAACGPSRPQLKRQIGEVLAEDPTSLVQIDGIATINAAKILAEVADVRRFAGRHHFASYTGTAPVDVSSGENNRHRLNRGGNRRLNHALHVAAVVQFRMPGTGQDYYRRKRADGKTHNEAVQEHLRTASLETARVPRLAGRNDLMDVRHGYATEHVRLAEKVIHLHYFIGSCHTVSDPSELLPALAIPWWR